MIQVFRGSTHRNSERGSTYRDSEALVQRPKVRKQVVSAVFHSAQMSHSCSLEEFPQHPKWNEIVPALSRQQEANA